MKESKVKNLIVGGDKVMTAEQKVGDDGTFSDKFGNTILITDSAENKERLKKLKAKKSPKKKAAKKKAKKVAKKKA